MHNRSILMKLTILPLIGVAASASMSGQTAEPNADATTTRTQAVGHYVPANGRGNDTISFTFSGGSFTSYGCKPVDPTYWMAGRGGTVTINFAEPEDDPSFRVWGMNTDDTAAISVNGTAYPLTMETASYGTKVVCGTSPGPDGVSFAGGLLTGSNTPSQGNYSYQDIRLNAPGVRAITIEGRSGAGWGFTGASVYRMMTVPPPIVRQPELPGGQMETGGRGE